MARGPLVRLLRKATAFVSGELGEGEIGVNTAAKHIAFSPDGSAIIKIPPFLSREFHAAGTIGILFPRAVTLSNIQTGAISGGTPTFTFARSTTYSGAQTAISTWPQSFVAGETLHITLVSMANSTRCAVAWEVS